MLQILIIYTTLRGNTGKMVEPVAEGIRSEGVEARVLPAEHVTMADMTAADGIVIGSPTRFGAVDWQIKRLFDEIAIEGYPGPLEGKVGGAFTAGSRLPPPPPAYKGGFLGRRALVATSPPVVTSPQRGEARRGEARVVEETGGAPRPRCAPLPTSPRWGEESGTVVFYEKPPLVSPPPGEGTGTPLTLSKRATPALWLPR